MRNFLLLSCIALLYLGMAIPVQAQVIQNESPEPPKKEFRSFWLATAGGMDWPPNTTNANTQREALRDIIHNTKAMGLNAVVFQVVPRGDAFYESERLPWSSFLTGGPNVGIPGKDPGWDPLAFAIEEAHKLGLELHAWYNVYMANREEYDRSPDSDPPHVYYSNPEWIEQVPQSGGGVWNWINPAIPEAREWIVGNVVEIVENYDVDAVHFDFIRYGTNYERDDSLMQVYNPAELTNMSDWRRENINMFARDVYAAVKDVKPWVKVGSTPVGHYRTSGGWAAGYGYSQYYQDSRRWAEEGVHDYVAPQLYWDIGAPGDGGSHAPRFEWLVDDWANDMRGRHYYLGTGPYRVEIKPQISAQIDTIRNSPAPGHMHFSYRNILDNPFGDSYRSLAIVPPMPWMSMRIPDRVKDIVHEVTGNNVTITWEEPTPGRGETDPFFRYVIYRAKASEVISDQAIIDNQAFIVDITGERTFTDQPDAGTESEDYIYYVTALSRNNVEGDFVKVEASVVSAEDQGLVAKSFELEQNYPNPFNPSTEIRFTIPAAGQVQLTVFDVLGREVAVLVNRELAAGAHTATFDAAGLTSGIYLYRLETAGQHMTRKMMLVK
ncbi:MAG: T9SS C-terminal target domain-containing protein [Balneolaceae bacterium]|nr:MAG: T9SS C-terminal target domain-containing protein [Balneolaceae bacterium]